ITCSLAELTQLSIFKCPHDDHRRDYVMNRFIFNLFPQKMFHPSRYCSRNCKIDQVTFETFFCYWFHGKPSLVFWMYLSDIYWRFAHYSILVFFYFNSLSPVSYSKVHLLLLLSSS